MQDSVGANIAHLVRCNLIRAAVAVVSTAPRVAANAHQTLGIAVLVTVIALPCEERFSMLETAFATRIVLLRPLEAAQMTECVLSLVVFRIRIAGNSGKGADEGLLQKKPRDCQVPQITNLLPRLIGRELEFLRSFGPTRMSSSSLRS